MAEDQGKEEEKFDFDLSGEALEYISLDQARVLAMRHARDNAEFYGVGYSGVSLVWEVISQEESEDYYDIKLSFRPAGRFRGEPGVEQFIIDKTGNIEIRQMLDEPTGLDLPESTSATPVAEPPARALPPTTPTPLPASSPPAATAPAPTPSATTTAPTSPPRPQAPAPPLRDGGARASPAVRPRRGPPFKKLVLGGLALVVLGVIAVVAIMAVVGSRDEPVVERERTTRDRARRATSTPAVIQKEVTTGAVAAATVAPVATAKPVVVEREVVKEVPVIKEVIKEVPVEVIVEKEVIKEVVVTPTPVEMPTAIPKNVAGPVVPVSAGTPKLGGIAVCQSYSAPTFFDVHRGAAANDVLWDSPMYNGLIELNPETDDFFDIRGDLAKNWEVTTDGLTYVFNLHENVTWHDGEPLTADDVVWSLERMVTNDEPRPQAGLIKPYYKDSEATDPNTVRVNTQFVSGAFAAYLGSDYMKIMPKHVYAPAPDGKGVDANQWDNIIGSGPFTLDSYRKDSFGELRKNEDYFRTDSEGVQRPYLDGIDNHTIIDRGTVAAAVRTGRIEFTCGGSRIDLDDLLVLAEELGGNLANMKGGKLQDEGKLNVYLDVPGLFFGYWLNTTIKPYDDPNVRRAIHLATDRQELIAAIGPIGTELVGAPMLPNSWFGKPEEEVLKLPGFRPKDTPGGQEDMAEALRLMTEAGYGPDNPIKNVLRFRNVGVYPKQAPVIKNQLKEIGIELELEQMESAAGFRAWQVADADIAVQATSFGVFEADVVVNTFYVAKGAGVGGRNYPDYAPDPKVAKLANDQARELDPTKRAALLQELEDHLLATQDTSWIGLMWRGSGRFALSHIKNYHLAQSGQGELKFEHIWIDRN